jgi:hypothetical protein
VTRREGGTPSAMTSNQASPLNDSSDPFIVSFLDWTSTITPFGRLPWPVAKSGYCCRDLSGVCRTPWRVEAGATDAVQLFTLRITKRRTNSVQTSFSKCSSSDRARHSISRAWSARRLASRGSVRSVRAVEHDCGAFLEVDCLSVGFDFACLGLHGPGSGVRSRFQVPHLQERRTHGGALVVSWRSTFRIPGQNFVNVAIARGRHGSSLESEIQNVQPLRSLRLSVDVERGNDLRLDAGRHRTRLDELTNKIA